MLKNSLKKKLRDWEWRRYNVPEALAQNYPTASKLFAVWKCRKYAVLVRRFPDETMLLTIADPTCRHNWHDMQRIKNDVLGPNWAAVEVYPPQHLVVDEANFYHLWCTIEKLRIGWDDGGEYTVRHTFYRPEQEDTEDPRLTEIGAARLLEGSSKIIEGLLDGNSQVSILPNPGLGEDAPALTEDELSVS